MDNKKNNQAMIDEQSDHLLNMLGILNEWKEIIRYGVKEELNPDIVLEVLKQGVYISKKMNGKEN